MNILDLGDLAMSALPQHATRQRVPQLHPDVIAEEQIEAGTRYVFAMRRGSKLLYRFPPEEWQLLKLFDGKRSYAEIRSEYARQTGIDYTEDHLRDYAETRLENSEELFYKTPAEQAMARLRAVSHRRHRRKRVLDLSEIRLLWFDPNRYLSWVYRHFHFIFTPGFTAVTLILWAWMAYVWAGHWHQIWGDSVRYYTFTDMNGWDLAEYWFLFLLVAVVHETAHGLSCYHWGAESHAMGFMLMWMTPAFFCDCAEIYIYGGKWERIGVSFAGMWSELLLCVVATAVWLGTASGMLLHELAYKIILVGGILLIVLNLNPLIKLDGYYIFTDLIGFPDLKEDSTSYLSNLVRRFLGLPYELPSLRPRRKVFYFVYAILSGMYSYLLLSFFAKLGYNIAHRFWPVWAWLPATIIALLLFKSRLKNLVVFMRTLYLDKKERWKARLRRPTHFVPLALAAAIVLFAPVWRDTVRERFVLEAPNRAVIRAEVSGRVISISAHEGQRVLAGSPVAQLTNLSLQSEAAHVQEEYQAASARWLNAEMRYADLGSARNEVMRTEQQSRDLSAKISKLTVVSPIAGIVVTPRPEDLLGSYVQSGTTIVEVAQTSRLRARLYIPEAYMRDVHVSAPASLKIDGTTSVLHAFVTELTTAPSASPMTGIEGPKYAGLAGPVFYAAWVDMTNPGNLRDGMVGEGKILIARRSLAGLIWRALADSVARRVW